MPEDQLRASEERFRLMADAIPQIVWITDAGGRTEFFNRRWEAYTGVPYEPTTAAEVAAGFVHPDDGPATFEAFEEARRTGTPFQVEHRIRSRSGDYRWFLVRAEPHRDPRTGEVIRWYGTSTDIHDAKLAEAALAWSERRFRALATATSDVVYRMSPDWDEMRHLVGREFLADTTEPSRTWLQEYIHPDDQRKVLDAIGGAVRTRGIFELEHRVVRVDGGIGWAFSRAVPILDDRGDILEWFGTASDVTERRRVEEDRRESEARYRTLFRSIDQGFCVVEVLFDASGAAVDYRFLETNPAFRDQTGLQDAEGRSMRELAPAHEEHWFEIYGRVARTGEPERFINEAKALDRWFDVYAFRLGGAGSHKVAILFKDVTQARRSELEIGESRGRLELAVQIGQLGTFEIDLATDSVTVNEPGRAIYGWTSRTTTFHEVRKQFHPDDAEEVMSRVDAALVPEGPHTFEVEQRIFRTDGEERWIRVRGRAFFEGGRAVRLVGTYLDFTERRRDEEALRRSEAKLKFLATLDDEVRALEDPEDVTAVTARLLGEHLGADRCAYAEVEDESVFVITGDYPRGVPSIVGRWPVGSFGAECTRLMLAGEPYVVHDTDADPRIGREDLPAYRAATIRAVICVPLHKGGRFTAAMAVHQKAPRTWTEAEVELVRFVVARCWESLERARVARSLRESEGRLRALVSQATAGIGEVDLAGRFILVNQKFCDTLGYTEDELLTMGMQDVTHPDDLSLNVPQFRALTEGGPDFQIEKRYVRKDGSLVWVNNSVSAVRDASGRTKSIVAVVFDVTQRRHAEDALRASEEALRDANRRKDEFLAMLAHELRNPLSAIGNAIQLVRRSPASEHLEWAKEIIAKQVRTLARMMDDLLDVSRITRGKIALQRQDVDVVSVVAHAAETVRPLVEERGHDLTLSLSSAPMRVLADPTRLEQVVVNLLVNAAKYTDPGGTIVLSARPAADGVVIAVRDNGSGIPPEQLPQMFELFAQGDRSIARSEGGLGIGLTLVKSLVEHHGGNVSARSEGPGRGSEFTVWLPAATQPAAERGRDERPGAGRTGKGGRVLVVDDNVDSARGLARLLELFGHQVEEAFDGAAALVAARRCRPEYILLDIGLPGMDGYEVARRLRAEGFADATIVAVSGYGEEAARGRTKEAGFDHHLVKPVDYEKLLEIMHRVP